MLLGEPARENMDGGTFTVDPTIEDAKLAHLLSLGLNLAGRRVLEVGAGIGRLTRLWEDLGCEIISTEGRLVNIERNLSVHPWRKDYLFQADVTDTNSHITFGHFDVVFCYGLLYHVPDPAIVIASLAALCDDLFLVESMVSALDGPPDIGKRQEYIAVDQGMYTEACLPTRSWFMKELGQHFPYVYVPRTQPNNTWYYPTEWPQPVSRLCRAVFVASRYPQDISMFTKRLPRKQRYHD